MQKKSIMKAKNDKKKDLANTLKLTKIHILKVGKRNRERSVIKEFLIRLQIRRSSHAATKDKNRTTWTFWEKKRPKSCFDCFPRCCFIVSQLKAKGFCNFCRNCSDISGKSFSASFERGEEGGVSTAMIGVVRRKPFSFFPFLSFSSFFLFYSFASFKGVKEGGSVNCSDWRGSLRTCKIVTSWLGSPGLQKPSCCKKRRRHKRKSKSVTTPLNPEAAAAALCWWRSCATTIITTSLGTHLQGVFFERSHPKQF